MAEIQNAANFPIGLPNGVDIGPCQTVEVPDWSVVKDHHMVKLHLADERLLVVGDDGQAEEAAAKAAAEQAAAEQAQKDADEKTAKK